MKTLKIRYFLIGDKKIDNFMNKVNVVNYGIRNGMYKVTYY